MSDHSGSKSARRRSLATRIIAWVLSILMMGSAATLIISIIADLI